ncbi:methyltransferase domain-containing protein [Amycolatopsis sp. H20-H5]|uniref:methyltransferase domain-containing protein n=1 Tax=Amycolatopsis sp. H20-H5 TaxID=3046309 RepID=UPI002DBB45F5|nr:methyltransferase domain-containing protein [Amycolatopsis sp. H20-H5]MEC3975193.1 methyltransferase domain-containing protein [Amycolatopsis sp. H20-H5]
MTATISKGGEFDLGLLGQRCWLELANGERIDLPVERWTDGSCEGDEVLLDACGGPTLDIGCGPGRLTAALTERGIASLGVDSSRTAVQLTQGRGAVALHRNVFDRIPGEGRWRHVLLADGNIGIGGNPVALLRRAAELLGAGGTALVELEPPGTGVRNEHVRLQPQTDEGSWFTWAWVGADAVGALAAQAGLAVEWTARRGHRWFAELVRT